MKNLAEEPLEAISVSWRWRRCYVESMYTSLAAFLPRSPSDRRPVAEHGDEVQDIRVARAGSIVSDEQLPLYQEQLYEVSCAVLSLVSALTEYGGAAAKR